MTDMNRPITFSALIQQCGRIEVPQIQRDYAQGREAELEVRESFLAALYAALTPSKGKAAHPLNLDFIYGSMEGKTDKSFLPLDGQQRLTTLFLLHWYLAWRDNQLSAFMGLVWDGKHSRFSYRVRPSSQEFFDALVQYAPVSDPDAVPSVKRLIEEQPWFFLYWRLDPTIQSALTMLDALHARFKKMRGLYARLVDDKRPAITFQLLQLEHFGLSDDLYIKMNARGKPLTAFETFKARFEADLKQFFPTGRRKLGTGEVSIPQFFEQRMDTQWTDFFWNYKNASNTFDDEALNLFGVLARVSLDPEETSFTDQTSLRGGYVGAGYTSFHEQGWLTKAFAENLICLLEAWSAGGGKLTQQLPNEYFFNELGFLQMAIKNPTALTYTDLVQFAALVSYLKQNEGSVKAAKFQEWARVIFNLCVNSAIDRVEDFRRALAGIQSLLPHSRQILTHLAKMDCKLPGFNQTQVREEILKAQLILAHPEWRSRIDMGEEHGYFRGQIEFLLAFSGLRAHVQTKPVNKWSLDEHAGFQRCFDDYCKKAQGTFDEHGLVNPKKRYLWQRALLTVGDYLNIQGRNYSFLTDPPKNWDSWKLFLRRITARDMETRPYLKLLWDKLDATTSFVPQLERLIAEASVDEPWRQMTITHWQVIDYCEMRAIRRNDSGSPIYLLKKKQMNGTHAELFSYTLHYDLRAPLVSAALNPLVVDTYRSVSGTDNEPQVLLSCDLPKCHLRFAIESTNRQFRIFVNEATGKHTPQTITLLRSQLGFAGSDQNLTRLSSREDIRNLLQTVATLLLELPE